MDIKNPKSWSKSEFEAFVFMIAASANLDIDPAERKIIKRKAGESFRDVKHAFASRNDAERIDAMLEGKEVHLTTPESHEDLKTHVHEVFMADDDYSMIERGIGSMLKRLL